jgi:hydroxymethylbilane synthase
VGTSSPRRAAQLRRIRPDLDIVMFRGNVDTRLAKLAAGEADATLLAAAGLERLGRHDVGHAIPSTIMLPAPAQGAVGIEARTDDAVTRAAIAAIDHAITHACVLAERALLAALQADCHSPVAALARIEGAVLTIDAELFSEDGAYHVAAQETGAPGDLRVSQALAAKLLALAPPEVARLFGG